MTDEMKALEAIDEALCLAARVDSWESFPSEPLEAAQDGLKKIKAALEAKAEPVAEGWATLPVKYFVVASEDEDLIDGIGNDFSKAKGMLEIAEDEQPGKAWSLLAVIDAEKSGLYTAPPSTAEVRALDVDALAQHIRTVDGNNSMGAGALAESICEFLTKRIGEDV